MYLQNTARDKGLADANHAIGTRLDQPVSIDRLTGVFSRHFLCELATARFSEARRHGYYASVVVLEVDRFAELLDPGWTRHEPSISRARWAAPSPPSVWSRPLVIDSPRDAPTRP